MFQASNLHVGTPPNINASDYHYASYFQALGGDQWIFTVKNEGDTPILMGGDIGWDNPLEVVEHPALEGYPYVHDLVLGISEYAWLISCWLAILPLKPGCFERYMSSPFSMMSVNFLAYCKKQGVIE